MFKELAQSEMLVTEIKNFISMKSAVVLFTFLIVLSSCNEQENSSRGNKEAREENLVGGWSEASVDEDVKRAALFAQDIINPNSKIVDIVSAKKQVVKGLNYDLIFTLENEETWQVIVYRDLDQTLRLTQRSKEK